jgi:hypothetical protein
MAILNITELKELGKDNMGQYIPVGNHGGVTVQEVTSITSSPQQSSAFQSSTGFIRLNADIDIRYAIGTNPTAGATSTRLAADVLEIIGVPRNKNYIISVRTA